MLAEAAAPTVAAGSPRPADAILSRFRGLPLLAMMRRCTVGLASLLALVSAEGDGDDAGYKSSAVRAALLVWLCVSERGLKQSLFLHETPHCGRCQWRDVSAHACPFCCLSRMARYFSSRTSTTRRHSIKLGLSQRTPTTPVSQRRRLHPVASPAWLSSFPRCRHLGTLRGQERGPVGRLWLGSEE